MPVSLGPLCDELVGQLAGMVTSILDAFVESGSPAPSVNSAQLAAVLSELEDLLQQGDMAAGDFARANAGILKAGLGKDAASLLGRIEAFDYEQAAAELRRLRHRSG
jgi:hypothetical protein